jgi:hypothetical protein
VAHPQDPYARKGQHERKAAGTGAATHFLGGPSAGRLDDAGPRSFTRQKADDSAKIAAYQRAHGQIRPESSRAGKGE